MSNLGEGNGLLIREAWFESKMGSQKFIRILLESHSGNCNGLVSRRETFVSSSLTSSTKYFW